MISKLLFPALTNSMRSFVSAIILAAFLASAAPSVSQAQAGKSAGKAQQPATPAPDKQPRTDGLIKGRVTSEGGRPVPDASIMTLPVNLTSNLQGMITSLFKAVNSDAEGKFELPGLAPGAYTISANSPGYVLSDSDSKTFYRPGDVVSLTLVKGGVITGKVTSLSGDPVIGAIVRAMKIRGADNKPIKNRDPFSEMGNAAAFVLGLLGPYKTDDRGVYRIYGLAPGYYQVSAGGQSGSPFMGRGGGGPYDGDAPTYFPSSTIDTAAEVNVRAGDEVSNIDIRYRENRGHSISGTVSGAKVPSQEGVSIVLTHASTGAVVGVISTGSKERGFVFGSLLDGEYIATAAGSAAVLGGAGLSLSISQSRTVTVRGADVTGIDLELEPLASIAGRVTIESLGEAAQKEECKNTRSARMEEIVLEARGTGKQKVDEYSAMFLSAFKATTPGEKGEFSLAFVRPGSTRLDVQAPGENLYVRSITLPSRGPDLKPIDAAKNGVNVKRGDKITGLVVTISEGAAGLRGRVVTGEENKPPAVKMRVYLVPSEPEAADNVLRYYEGEAEADGDFSLIRLAPGKYWLVAREISEQEQNETDHKPLAWDAGGRLSLRFEGEASKRVIELTRCQRVTDVALSYVPLIKPSKPSGVRQ